MSMLHSAAGAIAATIGLVLAAPLFVIGLLFLSVSSCVRLLASRLEARCIQWPDMFEFDAQVGWRAKGNLDCYCLEECDDLFHIRTDRDGWPGTLTVRDSDMVVFGDSNAFSYGVDHKHSFPQLIPDLKVKAIGVPGYNMVQELLLMERLAPQLKGKLVVWFCYIGNDLYDNLSPEMLRYRCPFVRLSPDRATWEIVTSHLSAESWRCSTGYKTLRRRGYPVIPSLHSDNLLSKRAYSACEALIERGQKLCTEYKCHLVIMSLPDPFALKEDRIERARETYRFLKELDAGYPDHKLRAICAKSGISFVALRQHLNRADYKTSHDHWTERGHRRVAEVLRGLYREHSGSRIDPNGLMDLVCSEPGCAL